MLKSRIILVVVCALAVWAIFLLPKVVVENESQLTAKDQEKQDSEAQMPHGQIPPQLSEQIRSLKAQGVSDVQNKKSAIFADSLSTLYRLASQFDSSALYAERAASFFNTKESFFKAGNAYYEAFTFAMNPAAQTKLAEKARFWLDKVVSADPDNLEAKSKLAMTYVNSSTPMQGIMMLREVLAKDPGNEFALFNMGMLSVQSGQYDKAIERLEELVKINPKHTQAQLLLGVSYMNQGKKEEARKQFEKVKQMDKDPAVQATVDSYLSDLKK